MNFKKEKIVIQISNQNNDCKFCEVKAKNKTFYGFCHCPAVLKEDNSAMIFSCNDCKKFKAVFKSK